MEVMHKDGVVENLHPLNLVDAHTAGAEERAALADPSSLTADVVGRPPLFEVYMRIHSEMNALVKSPGQLREKVAFITASPCAMCAKLVVQANISHVFYRERYRSAAGLDMLERGGIVAVHYTRWKDAWR